MFKTSNLGDGILESLEGATASDVASGLGLELDLLTGEGVDAHASLAGLLALDDELGAAVEGEGLALGVELANNQILEGGDDELDVLLVGFREDAQGVDNLGLGHVLTLGLGDGHLGRSLKNLVLGRVGCGCREADLAKS